MLLFYTEETGAMKSARITSIVVAAALSAVSSSACGSGSPKASTLSPSATPAETTPTPVETTTEPVVEPTEVEQTSFDPIADTPSSTAAVLSTTDSGRTLTLSDVFSAEGDWKESRYDIANRPDVQGIGVDLDDCREEYQAKLELRLAHRFSRLTMNVAQANTSENSDQTLVIEVITNGKQQDERRIPFDKIQPFKIDVRDVNAVEIRLWMEYDQACSYDDSIIAVVEKLTVYA